MTKLRLIYHWVTRMLVNMAIDFQFMLLGIFSEKARISYIAQYYPDAFKNKLEEKLKPIKFYLGSTFEYNGNTYVLTKDNNGEPHFDKLEIMQERTN